MGERKGGEGEGDRERETEKRRERERENGVPKEKVWTIDFGREQKLRMKLSDCKKTM